MRTTGTCFIQKIYVSSFYLLSKEEEGAYIFWMKQVPVMRTPLTHGTPCIHILGGSGWLNELGSWIT
jgi:hypothetical protein